MLEAQVARLGKEGEGLKAQVARLGKEGEGLKAQVASLRKEGEGLQQRVEEERGKTNEAKKKVSGSEWVWFLAKATTTVSNMWLMKSICLCTVVSIKHHYFAYVLHHYSACILHHCSVHVKEYVAFG